MQIQLYFNLFLFFFLQLEPENTEKYIDYLIDIGWLDEAALKLAEIIDDVCIFNVLHQLLTLTLKTNNLCDMKSQILNFKVILKVI